MKNTVTPQTLNDAFQAGYLDSRVGPRKNKNPYPADGKYFVFTTDPDTGKKFKIEYL